MGEVIRERQKQPSQPRCRRVRKGMSNRVRRELRKLREICLALMADQTCYFCRKALVAASGRCGNADGPKLTAKLTVHHKDGDHDNDVPSNRALAHRACHKAFHAREAAMKRRDEVRAAKRIGLVVL
jgi:5-methylcytosine-specific restriction endonuclease McrA